MNTKEIVSELDAEISRLTQVRELLAGAAKSAKRRGRPVGSINRTAKKASKSKVGGVASSKRTMSAEGKARIAAAQRERWARQNASAQGQAKKSPSSKKVSSKRNTAKSPKKGNTAATKFTAPPSGGRDNSPKKKLGRPPKSTSAKVNAVGTPVDIA